MPHPVLTLSYSTPSRRTKKSSKRVSCCPPSPCPSFSHRPVRDETRSGGIHFNDVLQHMAVDELPFSGIGESGCTCYCIVAPVNRTRRAPCGVLCPHAGRAWRSERTDDHFLADGVQTLKYTYDEYTHLRSSVDIPLA